MDSATAYDPRKIVDAYLEALNGRDYERARSLLADSGFEYVSPISRFNDADALIQYSLYSGGVVASMEKRKVFVDGDDVCHFLNLTTYMGDKRKTPVVHWAQVADGRIRRIEPLFDAHDYKKMLDPCD